MPLLPSFEELATHTQLTQVGMSMAISPSVCTLLSNGPIGSESFMQLDCTIQNKHLLISIDLTINSWREFEFTVKTMRIFKYNAAKLWNALAISVRGKPSLNSFKGAYLKDYFTHR